MLKATSQTRYPIGLSSGNTLIQRYSDNENSSCLAAFPSSKAAFIYSLSLVAVSRLNQRTFHILASPDVKLHLHQNRVYVLLVSSYTRLQDMYTVGAQLGLSDVLAFCSPFAQPLWEEFKTGVGTAAHSSFLFIQISYICTSEADTMPLCYLDNPGYMHCMHACSTSQRYERQVHMLYTKLYSL